MSINMDFYSHIELVRQSACFCLFGSCVAFFLFLTRSTLALPCNCSNQCDVFFYIFRLRFFLYRFFFIFHFIFFTIILFAHTTHNNSINTILIPGSNVKHFWRQKWQCAVRGVRAPTHHAISFFFRLFFLTACQTKQ